MVANPREEETREIAPLKVLPQDQRTWDTSKIIQNHAQAGDGGAVAALAPWVKRSQALDAQSAVLGIIAAEHEAVGGQRSRWKSRGVPAGEGERGETPYETRARMLNNKIAASIARREERYAGIKGAARHAGDLISRRRII